MGMAIRDFLRKLRVLRTVYYKYQFRKMLSAIPEPQLTKSIEALRSYKDKYKGQRCVIIGNGPSLTPEDLDALKNEITFASNRIYCLYDKTEWRPTFFCAQDDMIVNTIKTDLKEAAKESETMFLASAVYNDCKDETKDIENLVWMPLRYIPPKNDRYTFSTNASEMVVEGLSITYSCMQLAAYMGFKEIYLLGIDHNYDIEIDKNGKIVKQDSSVNNYFQGVKEMKQSNPPQIIEMTYAYMSAEEYSRTSDFRIYNATRGGKLEVFQRKDFDEIFHD